MRSRFFFFIFLFVVELQNGAAQAANREIKFGVNSSNSPPLLYQYENENMPIPTGGLVYEVSVAIGEDLHQEYSLHRVPRKRILKEIVSGQIDLICHNSMGWDSALKEEVWWSKPLYHYANVLVAKKEVPFVRLDQITSVKIGTVENYFYADLEMQFKNQTLQREDSVSVPINVKKLLADRIEYIIMSEIEFNYYKALHPELQRSSFFIGNLEVRCSLSKKSSLSLSALNKSIERLERKKIFKNIFARYLNPKTIPEPFSYGLNGDESPPFLFFDTHLGRRVVKDGLFIEIGLEIAKRIKRPVDFVLLPRGRLDSRLAEGQIALVCYNTEIWAGDYAKMYLWSSPIFRQSNFIVGIKNSKTDLVPQKFSDLNGQKVGAVLNFVYPGMASYFENGSIIREDAGSGLANIEKLNQQRIHFIILNNLEYNYYKKSNPKLQKSPFEFDPVDVKCAISKKSNLKINEINAAIAEMKHSGRMQKIFSLQ